MKIRIITIFILASIGTGLGVMYAPLWFLAPLGFAAHLHLLLSFVDRPRTALLEGWLYGTIVTASSLAWFWHMAPFDWLGSTSYLHGAYFAGTIWIATSILLGGAFALFSLLVWLMRESITLPYLIPLLYVLAAETSMWLHTIIALGSESLLEPHFSVPSLGYALTEQPYLLQFAEGGGVASLNIITGVLAVMPIVVLRLINLRADLANRFDAILALGVFICILTIPLFRTEPIADTNSVNVLVFSADTNVYSDKFAPIRDLVYEAVSQLDKKPDLVVFPEGYSLDVMFGGEPDKERLYENVFGDHDTLMVYSKLLSDNGIYNVVLFESTKRGLMHTHKKRYLAPEGEYSTHLGKLLLTAIPDPLLKKFARRNERVIVGPEPSSVQVEKFTLGALSCYEIFSPTLYASLAKKHGASILVNSSDPTWFHNSPLYFSKTLQMARMHAVQNRVPFIVANKGTASYILDARGKVVSMTPWNSAAYVSATILVKSRLR